MIKLTIKSTIIFIAAGTAGASAQSIMTVTSENRNVEVTALTDNILRVTNIPSGTTAPVSRTTVLSIPDADAERAATNRSAVITTATGVSATLDKRSGAVTISAGPDRFVRDNGIRILADGKQVLTLLTQGNESFYGAGERGHSFNLAGDTLVMYNRQNYGYTAGDPRIKQMNITMPLVISSNGYALLFDDYAAAEMILSNPIEYITESPAPVSYYFISGIDDCNGTAGLDDVVAQLSQLTGHQQIPPLWSLGYITSKYGYHTEAETRGVVDTLKRNGYPLDGIVLDLYWYGKEEDMGRLAWDREQWPNHEKMLSDLKKKGVNLVAISQPYVLRNGRGVDNYNELSERGLFVKDSLGNPGEVKIWVGEGGMFDVSNPDTRKWLADRYKSLTDGGVTGWWGDLGEPEVHPEGYVHANGLTTRQYHNLYGNDWSSIIFNLFREEYPGRRLMTMMRGGTVGLQRYNVFPWSTDVSRSWGGLQPQVVIMLNSGLSGLGYMSHDVGGFAVDKSNPVDAELYVRWLQLGAFSPIFRTHSTVKAEPYHYPEYSHIIKPLVKERYQWLPYNYTLAFENASEGHPLVRPLNYYDNSIAGLDTITDEYLWGRDVLLAPVLTKGTTSRKVVFPAGTWVDLTAPSNIYHGGDVIEYPAPLSKLPMFVRGGSLIPLALYEMDNTGDYRTDRYTLRFYPVEGRSTGYIFEDDLKSPTTVADKRYTLLNFAANVTPYQISIDMTARNASDEYETRNANKDLDFEIFNVASKPKAVTLDGRNIKFSYDQRTHLLRLSLNWDTAADAHLLITL